MSSRLTWLVFALILFGLSPAFAQTFVREPLSTFLQDPTKARSLLIGVQTMKSRPITVSASALSYESPTLPTDGSMPAWARRSVYLIETYCTLRSE